MSEKKRNSKRKSTTAKLPSEKKTKSISITPPIPEKKKSRDDVLWNSARFRAHLYPNSDSLKTALQIATDAGPDGLDLSEEFDNCPYGHVVKLWVDATNGLLVDQIITSSLLNVLCSNKIFTPRMFNFALAECAKRGNSYQMELLLLLPLPRTWLAEVKQGDDHALFQIIQMDKWHTGGTTSVACRLVERATDDYLDVAIAHNDLPDANGARRLHTSLHTAVKRSRNFLVSSLLARLPGIKFDIYTVKGIMVAQPLRLSLPTENTMNAHATRELVATAELVTLNYYKELKSILSVVLLDVLVSTLTQIVAAYSARMPLSNTILFFTDLF